MAEQLTFQERVIRELQQKLPSPRCPLCRSSDWDVPPGSFAFHYQHKSPHGISIMNNAHPCIALICKVCGNTHFISLAVLSPSLAKEVI